MDCPMVFVISFFLLHKWLFGMIMAFSMPGSGRMAIYTMLYFHHGIMISPSRSYEKRCKSKRNSTERWLFYCNLSEGCV